MTQKIVNVSEIEGYLRDIENIANVLPIRAILDKAPSVSGEVFGYVSDTTYSVTDSGTVRKTPNQVFKNAVYTTPQPDRVALLEAKIDKLMIEYCPNEMTKEQLDNWEKHQALAKIEE